MADRPDEGAAGRFAYAGLSRIFHEKARLGIMASLMTEPGGLVFNDLKELCSLTDGNLSRHVQVLSEAGFVEVFKGFERRKPRTLVRATEEGRERFRTYLGELERVVKDMHHAERGSPSEAAEEDLPPGWIPV